MVNSQEIIERTFYISLLATALKMGYTLNPDDYLPISIESQKRFENDKAALTKFIAIFGMGNNQVRGPKECPRITLELQGYYPGDIGFEKQMINDREVEQNFTVSEYPFESKDITIDVHLVANNQADMRLLHTIMYSSLPARGYIKPYFNNLEEWLATGIGKDGNLFVEVGNYYDHANLEHGLLEKVYTYICKDGLLEESLLDLELVPINDITILLGPDNKTFDSELLTLNVNTTNNT